MPKVSIAMRTRNDAPFVEKTIKAILSQSFSDFELLAFDNASTDGTREILEKFPQIKIFDIPEGKYIPGKVLNFAASKCEGEVVVFNNADAVVENRDWLKNLTAPLFGGLAEVAYARQTPRTDADLWVERDYKKAFGDAPADPSFFSMASSAAKIDVIKKYPFDEKIKYSEDVLWTKNLREKGLRIAYAPSAIVEHSHNYTIAEAKKRFAGEGEADAEILKTAQPFLSFLKGLLSASARDVFHALKRGKPSLILPAIRFRFAQKFSYYKARRSALKK